MSIADKYRPHYTYADYVNWEGNWELIDGLIYAMSPSPVKQHQITNGKLYTTINNAISSGCSECTVFMPLDWKVNDSTIVQPDLMVVCKEFNTDFLEFTPALVVEILSPSTAIKDRNVKYVLYQQEGVRYYLIADPKLKKLEIYELIDGKYQPVSINPLEFTFNLEKGCAITVSFPDIWA